MFSTGKYAGCTYEEAAKDHSYVKYWMSRKTENKEALAFQAYLRDLTPQSPVESISVTDKIKEVPNLACDVQTRQIHAPIKRESYICSKSNPDGMDPQRFGKFVERLIFDLMKNPGASMNSIYEKSYAHQFSDSNPSKIPDAQIYKELIPYLREFTDDLLVRLFGNGYRLSVQRDYELRGTCGSTQLVGILDMLIDKTIVDIKCVRQFNKQSIYKQMALYNYLLGGGHYALVYSVFEGKVYYMRFEDVEESLAEYICSSKPKEEQILTEILSLVEAGRIDALAENVWDINPECTDESGFTLAMHWVDNPDTREVEIPKWMWHESDLQDCNGETLAMHWYKHMQTPPQDWVAHTSSIQDNYGNTLAMRLIANGVNPEEWMEHTPEIRNDRGYTAAMLWIDAYHSSDLPQWMLHETDLQNEDGLTMAMLVIKNLRAKVPSFMHHDPNLRDKNGRTIAMQWSIRQCNAPEPWMEHDCTIQDSFGYTAAMYYIEMAKAEPPKWMRHSPTMQNQEGNTLAMLWLISLRTEPPEWMRHDAKLQNVRGLTVAMLLVQGRNKIKIQKWMHHDPKLQDMNGLTLAMLYVIYNKSDPPLWARHDPALQSKHGWTFAMYWITCVNGRPPKWSKHSPRITNNDGKEIGSLWANIFKTKPPKWMGPPIKAL